MIEKIPAIAVKDKIVIREIEQPKEKNGGLTVVNKVKNDYTIGTVVSIGGKVEEVKVGDVIVTPSEGLMRISIDDEEYIVVIEDNVLTRVAEEDEPASPADTTLNSQKAYK